jgi:hypothetical protein
MSRVTVNAFGKAPAGIATGQCLCGKVQVEISIPAFWAWHDHSRASRRAHGAAYAMYVVMPLACSRILRPCAPLDRFPASQGAHQRSTFPPRPRHGKPLDELRVRSADRRHSPN